MSDWVGREVDRTSEEFCLNIFDLSFCVGLLQVFFHFHQDIDSSLRFSPFPIGKQPCRRLLSLIFGKYALIVDIISYRTSSMLSCEYPRSLVEKLVVDVVLDTDRRRTRPVVSVVARASFPSSRRWSHPSLASQSTLWLSSLGGGDLAP